MSPLDHRYLVFLIYFSQAVTLVIYNKTENSKSLRSSKLVSISLSCFRVSGTLSIFLEGDLVEGIKHNELHWYFVGDEGLPLAIHLKV
jgi:hypothetical protein